MHENRAEVTPGRSDPVMLSNKLRGTGEE